MQDDEVQFPYRIGWEVEVGNPIHYFEIMDRAERAGLKVTTTTLPNTDYNPYHNANVFFRLDGMDKIVLATFVQVMEDEGLMKISPKTRGNMWKEINQGINETAEMIEWL